jgi:hypothetical protein
LHWFYPPSNNYKINWFTIFFSQKFKQTTKIQVIQTTFLYPQGLNSEPLLVRRIYWWVIFVSTWLEFGTIISTKDLLLYFTMC